MGFARARSGSHADSVDCGRWSVPWAVDLVFTVGCEEILNYCLKQSAVCVKHIVADMVRTHKGSVPGNLEVTCSDSKNRKLML